MSLKAQTISILGAEPVSLEEAYHHLRLDPLDSSDVTGRPDDALIGSLIKAAREHCEEFTGRSFVMKELEVAFSSWPDELELPAPPFISISAFTVSDDASDAALTTDDYSVDDHSGSLAVLTPTASWPTIDTGDVARVRYLAGHGEESSAHSPVPNSVKVAVLLLLGHWYSNREAAGDANLKMLPLGVESLLRPYRVLTGFA